MVSPAHTHPPTNPYSHDHVVTRLDHAGARVTPAQPFASSARYSPPLNQSLCAELCPRGVTRAYLPLSAPFAARKRPPAHAALYAVASRLSLQSFSYEPFPSHSRSKQGATCPVGRHHAANSIAHAHPKHLRTRGLPRNVPATPRAKRRGQCRTSTPVTRSIVPFLSFHRS